MLVIIGVYRLVSTVHEPLTDLAAVVALGLDWLHTQLNGGLLLNLGQDPHILLAALAHDGVCRPDLFTIGDISILKFAALGRERWLRFANMVRQVRVVRD
jgi:hypothetical protein